MTASRKRRPVAGMTLVEVMVSIAILAMIAMLVYGGFIQMAKHKERVELESDRHHVIRMALDRIQRELSMAYVSTHENPSPMLQTMKTAFVGSDSMGGDRVDFTSFSHQRLFRDAHESDQNEVSYFVTRHPEDRSVRVLARREDARIDDEPQEGGRVQILVEDIEDFQLEYLDPLTDEFVKTWDTTQGAMQPNRLPSQVRIELTLKDLRDSSKERVYATRASLPMVWGLNHANYL